MSFLDEMGDFTKWYRELSPAARTAIKAAVLAALLLVSGGFKACLGPVLAVAAWTLFSLETRTVPLPVLSLLGMAGLFLVLPAAALIETPVMLLAGTGGIWAVGVAATCEMLLIAAALALLAWRRESRFRYSAGITDFMVMGLWLGAGVEAGIGFLQTAKLGFTGQEWGLWPLFPGMLGRWDFPGASMGPSLAGLLAGLVVGLQRYLFGPDFGSWRVRGIGLAVLAVFAVWAGLERAAFAAGKAEGFGGFLFLLDLKGRLLAYLTILAGVAAIITERLLLQEQPAAQPLKSGWQTFRKQWEDDRNASWVYRAAQLAALQGRRLRLRELALAGEMKKILSGPDQAVLEKRLAEIQKALQK